MWLQIERGGIESNLSEFNNTFILREKCFGRNINVRITKESKNIVVSVVSNMNTIHYDVIGGDG